MGTDEAGADIIAVLEDVEVGDDAVVAYVTKGGRVIVLGDLAQAFFEVGDGILKACHLGGVLGGPGLNGEHKAVDKLTELDGRDVGVAVEGSQDGAGGQRRRVRDRGSPGRRGERARGGLFGGLVREVDRVGRHDGTYSGFLPVGGVIEAKRCEESERIEIEGVDWGVQFDNVRILTL